MIFEAFVVPTPKRVRRYFENSISDITNNVKKSCKSEIDKNEEDLEISKTNIEQSDYSVKKLGFSIKIF